MTPKHTPTPWATHGDLGTLIGADDGRMMLAEALHDHPVIEWRRSLAEAQANAELIVEAVNEYAQRLAAPPNTARRELADRIDRFEAESGGGEAWDLLNEAAEALRVAAQDDGAYDLLREVYDRTQDPDDGTCLEADIYERVNSLINDTPPPARGMRPLNPSLETLHKVIELLDVNADDLRMQGQHEAAADLTTCVELIEGKARPEEEE